MAMMVMAPRHDSMVTTPHRCAPYSTMAASIVKLPMLSTSSSSSSLLSSSSSSSSSLTLSSLYLIPKSIVAAFTTNILPSTNFSSSSSHSLRYICATTAPRAVQPLCARTACAPRWIARARSGGKRSRSNKRRPSNNDRSSSDSGRGGSDSVGDNSPTNTPKESNEVGDNVDDLTSLFEEDVGAPLSRSRKQGSKGRGDKKRGRKIQQAKPSPMDGLSRALPKSRQEAIDLLVRGAWVGIFAMFFIFVSVHLFIVGDWVGRK